MAKILAISDMGDDGSGYRNIITNICQGLSEHGHDVKVVGLENTGKEHHYDFGVIPVAPYQQYPLHEVGNIVTMVTNMWRQDVVLVALDIPHHGICLNMFKNRPFKYVGIMPVESDPLSLPWAATMMEMDKVFIISEFGTNEAKKMGVPAEHIQIGINSQLWRPPTQEERSSLRDSFNMNDDTFVVLTVADNQERKNLPRAMEIVSDLCKKYPNKDIRHIIKTKPRPNFGWDLDDYARSLGYIKNYKKTETALDDRMMWAHYAVSDVFLLTSKCEGYGIIFLEAMAAGVYPIGTNCTGIKEILADGRGGLIDYIDDKDLDYIDPFGNSKRYFAKRSHGVQLLEDAMNKKNDVSTGIEYSRKRVWKTAVEQVDKAICELV